MVQTGEGVLQENSFRRQKEKGDVGIQEVKSLPYQNDEEGRDGLLDGNVLLIGVAFNEVNKVYAVIPYVRILKVVTLQRHVRPNW